MAYETQNIGIVGLSDLTGKDNPFPLQPIKVTQRQVFYCELLLPGIPDESGDVFLAEDIARMCEIFSTEGRLNDVNIKHGPTKGLFRIVESFIVRPGDPEFQIPGAWVVAVKTNSEYAWRLVRSGELSSLSVESDVVKTPRRFSVEKSSVEISGTTDTADAHEHEYFLEIGITGNTVRGRTDTVNGHSHDIVCRSKTEKATRRAASDRSPEHSHNINTTKKFLDAFNDVMRKSQEVSGDGSYIDEGDYPWL